MSKKKGGRNVKDYKTLNVVSCIPVPQYKPRDNNLVNFLKAQRQDFEDEDDSTYDEATFLRNENRKRTDDMIRKAKEQLGSRKNSLDEAKENVAITEDEDKALGSVDALSILRQMEKMRNESDHEVLKRDGLAKQQEQKKGAEYFSGTKLSKGKGKTKHKPQRVISLEELERRQPSVPSGAAPTYQPMPSVPRTSCWHKKSGADLFVASKQDLTLYNGSGNEEELLKRAIAESLKCHQTEEANRFAEMEKLHMAEEERQRRARAELQKLTAFNVVPEFEDWDSEEYSTNNKILQKSENVQWGTTPKYVDDKLEHGQAKHGAFIKPSSIYFNGKVATRHTSLTMEEEECNLQNNTGTTKKTNFGVKPENEITVKPLRADSDMKAFAGNKTTDRKQNAFKQIEQIEHGDWETKKDEPTAICTNKSTLEVETEHKPQPHTTTTYRKPFSGNRSLDRVVNAVRERLPKNVDCEDWDEEDDSTIYCAEEASDLKFNYKNVSTASTSYKKPFSEKTKEKKDSVVQEPYRKDVECENWEDEHVVPAAYSKKKSIPDHELNYRNMSNIIETCKIASLEARSIEQEDWEDEPRVPSRVESRFPRTPGNNNIYFMFGEIDLKSTTSKTKETLEHDSIISFNNSGRNTVDSREKYVVPDDLGKKFQTTGMSSCRKLDDGKETLSQTMTAYADSSLHGQALKPVSDSSRIKNLVSSVKEKEHQIAQVKSVNVEEFFKFENVAQASSTHIDKRNVDPVPAGRIDNISRSQIQHHLSTSYNPSNSLTSCLLPDSLGAHPVNSVTAMKTVNEIESALYGTQGYSDQVPKSLKGVNIDNTPSNQTQPTLLDSHIHDTSSQSLPPHSNFIFSQTQGTLPTSQFHHISPEEMVAKMNISQANQSVPIRPLSAEEMVAKMNSSQANQSVSIRPLSSEEMIAKMNISQANQSVPMRPLSAEEMVAKMDSSQANQSVPMRPLSVEEMVAKMNSSQANQPVPMRQLSAEEMIAKMNIPQATQSIPTSQTSPQEMLHKMNNSQASQSVPSGMSPEEMFLKMNAFNFPFQIQNAAQNKMLARMNPLANQSLNTLPPNFIPGISANPMFLNMSTISPPNQVPSAATHGSSPETASVGMTIGMNIPGMHGHQVLQTAQTNRLSPDPALPVNPVLNVNSVPENKIQQPLSNPHVPVGAVGSALPNPSVQMNNAPTNKVQQTFPNTQMLNIPTESVLPNSNSAMNLNNVPENQGQQQPVPMNVPQAFTAVGPDGQPIQPLMMPLTASMLYNNYWLQSSMLNPYMASFYPQMAGINPAGIPLGALAMNYGNLQNNNKLPVPTLSATQMNVASTPQPGNLHNNNMPEPTIAPHMNVGSTSQSANLQSNSSVPLSASPAPHVNMFGVPLLGNMQNMNSMPVAAPSTPHMNFMSTTQPLSQIPANPGILGNSGLAVSAVPGKGRGRLRH